MGKKQDMVRSKRHFGVLLAGMMLVACSSESTKEVDDDDAGVIPDSGSETGHEDPDDGDAGYVEAEDADVSDGCTFGDEYTTHDRILIIGNDEFRVMAAEEGWPGDGTEGNPYLIEGYNIDLQKGEGGAIEVRNTDVHFIVRRCFLHGGMHNLATSGYGYGVLTYGVKNMRVECSVAIDNFEGVRLEKGTESCIIHYNDLSKNLGHGVALASANNNIIEYNLCTDESDDGMLFGSFDVADNLDPSHGNIVRFNEFSRNSTSGVCLFRGSGNVFYGNAFGMGNGTPVLNTAGQNTWHNEEEKFGNWWAQFQAPDENGDGILDSEKTISGGGVDPYPLAEKPKTTP